MKKRSMKKLLSLLLVLLIVMAFPLQPASADTVSDPNVELTLVTGTTNLDVSDFAADVKAAVYEIYGIPSDRLNINIAGTTVVDQKNDFDWITYDHYYAPDYPTDESEPVDWSVYHSVYQPYFYYPEDSPEDYSSYFTSAVPGDVSMSACYYRSKHIYTNGSDLIFLGYSAPAFKDFMVFPDQTEGEKTIEFAIDESGVSTHTLEGAGFLFNTSIVENKINGYLVYYNYQNETIELYQLTNVDATAFHQEENNAISSLQIPGIQKLASKDMPGQLNQSYAAIKHSTASPLKVFTDGGAIYNTTEAAQGVAPTKKIKVQVTANSLKFYEDGVAIYDTTGADSGIVIQDTGAGGFGPLVGYSSHWCSELSYFTFKDLAMVSTRSVSFMDVLNEQAWSPNSKRIIVNLDDDSVPEFSDSTLLSQIASQLTANTVHYLGWGHNLQVASGVYNKDQAEQLIAQNNNKGMFINLDDPNCDTYEKSVAAIAQYINMVLTPEPDTTPPTIGVVTPSDGANVHSVNSISVALSDTGDGVNAAGSNISVVGGNSGTIAGSVVWADGKLTFTPTNPLPTDAYTVTVTVADNGGNRAELVIHFTVSPQPTNDNPGDYGDSGDSGDSGSSAPANPPEPAKPKVLFTDMVNHWAQADVDKLATDKFVYGFPDGTFKPDNSVTRAEFAATLFKVFEAAKLKQTTNNAVYFSDVSSDDWYYKAVNGLAPEGIIMGYGDGTFGPDKLITREEAACMLTRMVTKVGIQVPDNQLNFKDNDQISQWAKDSVRFMASLEIIKGMPDGTFQPAKNATRSEAAVMILRLMQKAKLI